MISNAIPSQVTSRSSSRNLSERVGEIPLIPFIGFTSILFMATCNLMNVEIADEKVTLDAQLLAKLGFVALSGLYGLYGFFLDSRVRRVLTNNTTVCLLALSAAYLLTAVLAVNKTVAVVSSGAILVAILAMTTFCVQHGREKALRLIFYSVSLFLVGSWIAYLLFPAVGVFNEPLEDGAFLARMGGLSHPNTLGQYSALGLIVGACLWRTNAANRTLVVAVMILAAVALYFSLSRTSTAAAIGGLAIVYRDKLWNRQWITIGLAMVAIGTAALLAGSAFLNLENKINDKVVGLLSKTSESSSEELTTATGRSVIWEKAVSLIQERPLTGWGAGSSKDLLIDYSQYTHNLFLNVWLSSGLMGGMFITLLTVMMLYKVIAWPSMVADSLIVFILLNGLFENVIFSNVASAPTLVFTMAIIWRYIPRAPKEEEVEHDSANS